MDAASQAAIATQKMAYDFAMEKQQREEAISAIKALRNPNAIRTMGANPNGATQAAPDQSAPDQSSPSLGQIANGGSPMGDAPPDQSSPSLGAAQPGQPAQAAPSLGSAQPAPSSSAAIMPPAAPRRTALQTLQDTSDQLSGQINVLQNQGTLSANTMANALRVQKTQVDEKLPLAEKEAADTQLKTDSANYQKWAAVNSQQDLNNLTSTAPDGLKTMLAKIQIYPDLNGQYNLADPRVQQFVRDAQNHASTVVEKAEMAAKIANTAHQIAEDQQAKANLAQKTQYENAQVGIERQKVSIDQQRLVQPIFDPAQNAFVPRPKTDAKGNILAASVASPVTGLGASPMQQTKAAEIRVEMTKALAPVDATQQKITKVKQLLASSNSASDIQVNQALTDIFDPARLTNAVYKDNKNFGSLGQKIAGFMSETFAGRYTDAQRSQIKSLVNEMQSNVVDPQRNRIVDYHQNIAKAAQIPTALVPAPNFYQDQNPQAEAANFLSGMIKKPGSK